MQTIQNPFINWFPGLGRYELKPASIAQKKYVTDLAAYAESIMFDGISLYWSEESFLGEAYRHEFSTQCPERLLEG